jgi:alkaline phosphatase
MPSIQKRDVGRGVSRRGILAAIAATAAGAALPAAASSRARRPGRAKNVIFLVVDGMSAGTLTIADECHRRRAGTRSNWIRLMTTDGVRRSLISTASADSLVTDSAAASSAWSLGQRVKNGSISITADGKVVEPLLVRARRQGKATGLVTTTRVTHATPAGFIANVPERNMEREIATQILDRGVDIVLGGGVKYFDPEAIRKSGVNFIANRSEMLALEPGPKPVLGLFAPAHMAFELERPPEQPSLLEMSKVALERLKNAPNGFVIQIEGGRVDHAGHNNDAPSLVRDQLAFDETLGFVRDWSAARDDTLVIVTTDHGTANPGLTIYGQRAERGLDRLMSAKHSFDWIFENATPLRRKDGDQNAIDVLPMTDGAKAQDVELRVRHMCDLVRWATDIQADRSDQRVLRGLAEGAIMDPFGERSAETSVLGSILSNYYGVGFVSGNHTSDLVECLAWGPASELVGAVHASTDLHDIVVRALDLGPAV